MSFRHIIAAGLVVGIAGLSAVDAGGRRGGHRGGHKMGPRPEGGPPRAALNLSEDQKVEAQALREKNRAAVQVLRSSGEANHEEIKALHKQQRAAFEGILTDVQKVQLEEIKAQRKAAREELNTQRQAAREEAREERAARLGLTDDQKKQLQALRDQGRAEIKELRGSEGVTREDVEALRKAQREAAQAVLTEEQQLRAAELRAERQAEGGHRPGGHKRRFHRGYGPKPADGDEPTGGDGGEESIIIDGDAAKASAATAVESTTWGAVKSGGRRQ